MLPGHDRLQSTPRCAAVRIDGCRVLGWQQPNATYGSRADTPAEHCRKPGDDGGGQCVRRARIASAPPALRFE